MGWLWAQGNSDGGGFDLDPARQLVESLESMLAGLFGILPNLILGLVVLAAFWFAARTVRRRLEPRLTQARSPSFGRVFSRLAGAGVVLVGVLVAVPLTFPTVNALSILGGLGLLGVAAGFAFQDILSNLLSGILLILRQPFDSGDQIQVGDVTGTVQYITIRETQIRTFDGREVFVPNADVYQGAITVQTAHEAIRTSLLVGVSYEDDLGRAREVALKTLDGVDGVRDHPAPQAYYVEFGGSSINLDLRYWTASAQAEVRRVQDAVVEAIYDAFGEAGVDIPFDIITLDTLPSFDAAMAGGADGRRAEVATD